MLPASACCALLSCHLDKELDNEGMDGLRSFQFFNKNRLFGIEKLSP